MHCWKIVSKQSFDSWDNTSALYSLVTCLALSDPGHAEGISTHIPFAAETDSQS